MEDLGMRLYLRNGIKKYFTISRLHQKKAKNIVLIHYMLIELLGCLQTHIDAPLSVSYLFQ